MADFTIHPKNDFAKFVKAKEIADDTGVITEQVTGSVTAFFATSDAPDAVTADPSLELTDCPYVEGKGFLVFFDRILLDFDLLDGLFASTPPVLIIDDGEGWRVAFTGEYDPVRVGTVK